MQSSDPTRVLIRLPLLIPLAIAAVTAFTLATGARPPAPRPEAELEVELVSRLQRLSRAVLARNPGAIAALMDDSFTDERGRDKYAAVAALTAKGATPPLGYRPDREVFRVAPGRHATTVKNTVRIFSQNPRTHGVSAVDVTVTTDWVLTPNGWLLRHTHKPVRTPVQVEGVFKSARAGSQAKGPL